MKDALNKALVGIINPLFGRPCFATPIFGKDLFYIQVIDANDKINCFNEILISQDIITVNLPEKAGV